MTVCCCCELYNKPDWEVLYVAVRHLRDAAISKVASTVSRSEQENLYLSKCGPNQFKEENSSLGFLKPHDIHKTLHHLQVATSYHTLL